MHDQDSDSRIIFPSVEDDGTRVVHHHCIPITVVDVQNFREDILVMIPTINRQADRQTHRQADEQADREQNSGCIRWTKAFAQRRVLGSTGNDSNGSSSAITLVLYCRVAAAG